MSLSPDDCRTPGGCWGHVCSHTPGARQKALCFSNFVCKEKAEFPLVLLVCLPADTESKSRGSSLPSSDSFTPDPRSLGSLACVPGCLHTTQISVQKNQTQVPITSLAHPHCGNYPGENRSPPLF